MQTYTASRNPNPHPRWTAGLSYVFLGQKLPAPAAMGVVVVCAGLGLNVFGSSDKNTPIVRELSSDCPQGYLCFVLVNHLVRAFDSNIDQFTFDFWSGG